MANRYWVAIIGPVDDKLIEGTNPTLRFAAETAAAQAFGDNVQCNSSWVSEEVCQRIMDAKYKLPEAVV